MDFFDQLGIEAKADEMAILMVRNGITAVELSKKTGIQACEISRATRIKRYGITLDKIHKAAQEIIREKAGQA